LSSAPDKDCLAARTGTLKVFVTVEKSKELPEIRCGSCGKLLAKGRGAELSIKCPRCGGINLIKSGETAKQ
jgi:LSD1 subclass zinc finger protein